MGALGSTPAAHAAGTYTVTQANDDGTGGTNGSLSWAIAQANGNPGSTVDFTVPGGSISIDGTMPHMTAATPITGPARPCSRSTATTVPHLLHRAECEQRVTISGVTLANGHVDAGSNDGGAILSRSGLTLSASVVTGSLAASDGGGLYFGGNAPGNAAGHSTFSGNSTIYNDDGGAIASTGYQGPSSVSITNSTFSANLAGGAGRGSHRHERAHHDLGKHVHRHALRAVPRRGEPQRWSRRRDLRPGREQPAHAHDHREHDLGNVAEQYGGGGLQMYAGVRRRNGRRSTTP